MRIEATSELAKTCTGVRGPSPPDEPVADWVSFALISCLTYKKLLEDAFRIGFAKSIPW